MRFPGKNLSPLQLVLVALVVLFFVVAPLSSFTAWKFMQLRHANHAQEIRNHQTARNNEAQAGLDVLQQALEGSTYYEQNQELYSFVADTLDFDHPAISFSCRVPDNFPGSVKLGKQNLRRIDIGVEDGETFGERSLVMYQTPLLQSDEEMELADPERHVLIQNLDTFMVMFWSSINNEWMPDWEEINSIPARIQIEMAVKRADGTDAQIADLHKREIVVFTDTITQAMQNPRMPASRRSKGGSRSSRGRAPSGSPQPTADQTKRIADWRKQQEVVRRRSDSGKRQYSEAEKAAWRKEMAERYAKAKQATSGGNPLPPGMVSGELGMLLYKGEVPPSSPQQERPAPAEPTEP